MEKRPIVIFSQLLPKGTTVLKTDCETVQQLKQEISQLGISQQTLDSMKFESIGEGVVYDSDIAKIPFGVGINSTAELPLTEEGKISLKDKKILKLTMSEKGKFIKSGGASKEETLKILKSSGMWDAFVEENNMQPQMASAAEIISFILTHSKNNKKKNNASSTEDDMKKMIISLSNRVYALEAMLEAKNGSNADDADDSFDYEGI